MNYIEFMQLKIVDDELREAYKMNPQDFTRNRKISFDQVLGIIMSKPLHTNTARINMAYEKLYPDDLNEWPTQSAYIQRREKVNPVVFQELLNISNEYFYMDKEGKYTNELWKEHNLLAVDGSRIDIFESPENEMKFSRMRSHYLPGGVLQGMISCLYDVENSLPISVTLGKVESEKIPVFHEHLPFLESKEFKKWLEN